MSRVEVAVCLVLILVGILSGLLALAAGALGWLMKGLLA